MYPETKGRTIEEVAVIFDHGRTGKREAVDEEVAVPASADGERGSMKGDGDKGEVYHAELAPRARET